MRFYCTLTGGQREVEGEAECPLLAISGYAEGRSRASALPPKADITGEKLHRSLKADIRDCVITSALWPRFDWVSCILPDPCAAIEVVNL